MLDEFAGTESLVEDGTHLFRHPRHRTPDPALGHPVPQRTLREVTASIVIYCGFGGRQQRPSYSVFQFLTDIPPGSSVRTAVNSSSRPPM